jgi:hypothetical protein
MALKYIYGLLAAPLLKFVHNDYIQSHKKRSGSTGGDLMWSRSTDSSVYKPLYCITSLLTTRSFTDQKQQQH